LSESFSRRRTKRKAAGVPEAFEPPLSVRFFQSKAGRAGVEGNEFIFTRDLPTGVMPISGISGAERYRATLEPADEDSVDRITRLLDVGQYSQDDLSEAVREFVENATNYIGYSGEVFYEIAQTPERGRDPAGVRLLALPPGLVVRTPRAYYQVIPKADRKELGKGWAIRIPRAKVWRIMLPRHLGGVRQHRRMLKLLRKWSSPTPSFMFRRNDMGRGAGYDFTAHDKACDIGTQRATRRWGTMPSFFRVKGTTEYFSFARSLAWKRSQAQLRDHILEELNSLLRHLGFTSQIVVEGLTSPEEVGEMMSKLQRGDVTVKEAMAVDKD
jgi:hypothetical protein